MAPGLAARTAIVCVLLFGVAIAHAQPGATAPRPPATGPSSRRPVAVIDLTADARTTELASALNNVLLDHRALRPLLEEAGGELVGVYADEDAGNLTAAQLQRDRANQNLLTNQRAAVISAAQGGEESLHRVVPTSFAVALYADLAFAAGVAHLGDRDAAKATAAFTLSDRLVPGRKLDDNTTTPDVVAAFEAARAGAATAQKVLVMVKGSGRVWIDGRDVGLPGLHEMAAGPHVVWLTGPERFTDGTQANVVVGKPNLVEIKDNLAPTRVKIIRARVALRTAVDASARASAMKTLSRLVKVGDAVLISLTNDKVIVQTWRDQAPGFSSLSEYKGERPLELLEVLSPTPKVVEKQPPPWIPPIETPWYRKRNVKLGVLATIVVVAGVILASSFEGKVPTNTNPTAR